MPHTERRVEVTEHSISVSDPARELEYAVSGWAPVQAFGTYRGRDIYFRARWDEWTFEVADDAGRYPSDDVASTGRLWHGTSSNASYLPLADAVDIIERCLQELTPTPDQST